MIVEGEQAKEMIDGEEQALTEKKTYKTATKVTGYQAKKGVWQVLSVVAIVLSVILFFGSDSTKWMYFWFFALSMAPFLLIVLKKRPDSSLIVNTTNDYLHVAETDDDTNYIPGIRDFDGTYFAARNENRENT